MKQNERLLVYAVTGFLALILVIAVMFGNDPVDAASKQENTSKGLNDILQPKLSEAEVAKQAEAKAKALAEQLNGSSGGGGSNEQPLNARPLLASDVVARELGPSRKERFVRWVPVKRGDAFEKLVRRWCGGTEGYLEEALRLNEETTKLTIGSQVMVPWVDDEVLAAIIEAEASEAQRAPTPRTLIGNPNGSGSSRTLMNPSRGAPEAGMPRPSVTRPGFAMPGRGPSEAETARDNSSDGTVGVASVGEAMTYTVKSGDNLWSISAKRYGKGKADKMVKVILSMNPGLSSNLKVGQEFKMPTKAE